MQKRTVSDTIYNPDGTPAAAQTVTFTLEGGSFTPTEYVIERSYSTTTNFQGKFTLDLWCTTEGLSDSRWVCTLPDGEVVRFELPYSTTPIALRTLRVGQVADRAEKYDAETWQRLKAALLEYSGYRPNLVYEAFVPAVGYSAQQIPAGTIGIESINYGVELTLTEVMTATEGTQGWCLNGIILYLTPVPVDATAIPIVWRRQHVADELTQTFPTVPEHDQLYLHWLARADEADSEQAAIEAGLSSYTIGSTTVKWSGQGGGQTSGTSRAERLRQRALSALSEPSAEWG